MRVVSATVLNIKSPTLKSGDAYCLLPNVCNAQPPWWVMALTDHKTCTFYGCLPNNANVERSLLITSVLHSTPACFIQSSGPLDFGVSLGFPFRRTWKVKPIFSSGKSSHSHLYLLPIHPFELKGTMQFWTTNIVPQAAEKVVLCRDHGKTILDLANCTSALLTV